MGGRILGVLLVGLLAGIAGCSGEKPEASESPSAGTTASSGPSSAPPVNPSAMGGHPCVVDPPMPNPEAPPYKGKGPHLVAAGVAKFDRKLYTEPFKSYYLPAGWRAPVGKPGEDDSSGSQLSVCKTGLRQTGTKPIATCHWDFGSSKVYPATHLFRVYETRTGRLLSTFSVAGDITDDFSCPQGGVQVPIDEGAPDVAQDYDFKTIEARLRWAVLTTVR
jgi:hypothetical protein